MKLLKKSLACLLSVMLLLSCIPLSAAAAGTTDVTVYVNPDGDLEVTVNAIDTSPSVNDTLEKAIDIAITKADTGAGATGTYSESDIVKLTVKSGVTLTQDDMDYIWDYTGTTAGGPETLLDGLKILDLSAATLGTGSIAANQFDAVTTGSVSPTLEEVLLPTTIAAINANAFEGQTELVSVNFSSLNALTTIGADAFVGTALTTVDLSGTILNTISSGAFSGITTLTHVDMSDLASLALNIADTAFAGCSNMTMINLTGTTPVVTVGGTNVFYNNTSNQVKVVVESSKLSGTNAYTNTGGSWATMTTSGARAQFVHMTEPQDISVTGTGDNTITFKWSEPSYIEYSAYSNVYYQFYLENTDQYTTTTYSEWKTTPIVDASTLTGTSYTFELKDVINFTNYNVFNVKMRVVGTTATSVYYGPWGAPDDADFVDEVLVVPTEAEKVDIGTDFAYGSNSYQQNATATALTSLQINEPDNIVAGALAGTGPVGSTPATGVGLVVGDETYYEDDLGKVTYQWYYDTTGDCDPALATAVGSSVTIPYGTSYPYTVTGITPDTSLAVGDYYYFVVFTNTNPMAYDTSAQTSTTVSKYHKITIQDPNAAKAPVITLHPVDASYVLNETSEPLEAAAYSTDGGTIYYYWMYSETTLSSGSFSSTGTVSPIYTTPTWGGPATDKYGTFYYYADVENENPYAAGGSGWLSTTPATITVTPEHPVITGPDDVNYDLGDTVQPLTATATVGDGGTLTYQWYYTATGDTADGVAIAGETSASYTPDSSITASSGVYYYYVEVTNTNTETTHNTTGTYTETSAVARVSVDGTDAETPTLGSVTDGAAYTGTTGTVLTAPTVSDVTSSTAVVTYQWYQCDDTSKTNATAIPSATGSTYEPDTTTAGTYYYYVEVTNTDTAATGLQVITVESDVYTFVVTDPPDDAETPALTDPADADYETGDTATPLSVTVSGVTSPTASLSYEWFSCAADGSNPVSVGTSATYTPDTSVVGDYYYYVVVTNSDSAATITPTVSATSGIAKVTVTDPVTPPTPVDADTPVITTQPEEAKYDVNDAGLVDLTVEANVTDGGTLSYQWYTCDADGSNATPITGANSDTYTPDISAEGTTYYYVVVTNTNTSATGNTTATETSDIVSVTVEKGYVPPVEYTVTFMDGEDELTDLAVSVEDGEKVTKPEDPEKEGYVFKGWYTDAEGTTAYDFDEPVTEDLVLYAVWEEEVTTHEPYVAGYDDGTFRPNASITRAEAAQMFYNILGYPDVDDVEGDYDGYPDVNDKGWYGAAVQVLSKMEVIKGDTDGNFRPNDSISRAEFSSMVQLFYELDDGDAAKMPFTDVGSTHWARTAIAAVYEADIVVGTNTAGTLFEPNSDITRAQAVTMLNKAQGRYTYEELWDDVEIPFSDVTTAHWGWTQIMEAAVEHEHPAATETETAAEE